MKKFCLLFLLIWLLSACSPSSSKEKKVKQEDEIIPVEVTVVRKVFFPLEIVTVGTVLPWREVIITPKVAGRIEKIFVKEGDLVKAGDLLVKLEQTDFILGLKQAEAALATAQANLANLLAGTRPEKIEQAKAALHQAAANLANMEKEYQRIKRLAAIEAVAQRQLDAVTAQYESALAQVKQAQEQLEMLQKGPTKEEIEIAKAQVKQAETTVAVAQNYLRDSQIRAPFSGFITARFVDEGVQVYTTPKTDILKLTDVRHVKIEASVPERYYQRVRIGTKAQINLDALPGEIFPGQVSRIIPEVNQISRNFKVEIDIPNPHLRLKSGMFANVVLFVGEKETLAITRDVLIVDQVTGVSYAFVIEGDQAGQRKLTLGERSGVLIEVLHGLKEGEKLVVKGQTRLKSGSKVKIVAESKEITR
ncbi:MAG: efflux RND transporter periplasmic adaptor subunit [bacterium]